jgi:hypothetical protein
MLLPFRPGSLTTRIFSASPRCRLAKTPISLETPGVEDGFEFEKEAYGTIIQRKRPSGYQESNHTGNYSPERNKPAGAMRTEIAPHQF